MVSEQRERVNNLVSSKAQTNDGGFRALLLGLNSVECWSSRATNFFDDRGDLVDDDCWGIGCEAGCVGAFAWSRKGGKRERRRL